MVLLRVMHELSAKHGWQLAVAHLNHQLRGRSGDADERLARRTAARLRLPIFVGRADVRKFARAHTLSLEMAARQRRHDFLARTALRKGICTIALAHHADDQVELFFLRLLRGSGGEGLAGMNWRNPSPSLPQVELVRPLLDLPKSTLKDYAFRAKVPYREDATNACLDVQRNRLRHELLPLLRRKYQPAVNQTVRRISEIVGVEADFVARAASDWLQRMRRHQPRPVAFEKLHVAVQRRCIQLQLLKLGINADFELVERLRLNSGCTIAVAAQNCAARTGREKTSPMFVSRDQTGLVRRQVVPRTEFQKGGLELDLSSQPREAMLDGVRIRWRIASSRAVRRLNREVGFESFDAEKVGSSILLRHWRAGDRFQPIGMSHPVKLQDFFTNEKVARTSRHELLIGVAANGQLFWVEGQRISEQFKLTRATRRRLRWWWERL